MLSHRRQRFFRDQRLKRFVQMCFVKSHAMHDQRPWRGEPHPALLPGRIQRGPSVNDGSFPQRSTSTEVANVVFSLPTKSIGLFP
jgi:hypothetical protein